MKINQKKPKEKSVKPHKNREHENLEKTYQSKGKHKGKIKSSKRSPKNHKITKSENQPKNPKEKSPEVLQKSGKMKIQKIHIESKGKRKGKTMNQKNHQKLQKSKSENRRFCHKTACACAFSVAPPLQIQGGGVCGITL